MVAAINDLDHAFASAGHDLMVGARAVVSWEQRKVSPDAAQIEALSSMIPVYGPEVELFERLIFASFGVLAAALHVNGGNVKAVADANPAISPALLTEIQSYLQANPGLFVLWAPKASSTRAQKSRMVALPWASAGRVTFYVQGRFQRVEFHSDFVTRMGGEMPFPYLLL